MLGLLFGILFVAVFGRLIIFAIRMAWGITRVAFSLIFLPFTLLFAVIGGLIKLALPLLVVVGVVSLFTAGKRY